MESLGDAAARRIGRLSLGGVTRRETAGCRQQGGEMRSLMGEVVPRCGAGAHQDHRLGEIDELCCRASLRGWSSSCK